MSLFARSIGYIIILSLTTILTAQVSISGTIADDEGQPLAGANVFLAGTPLGSATNTDGNYKISNVDNGEYTLVVKYLGYLAQEISVNVSGTDITQNAQLSRAALEIEALQVTGTIIKDRVTPFPHSSLTSDDLELRTASCLLYTSPSPRDS